jgi:hypothetical protein
LLYRVILASEAVGTTGATTLSVAQILGASEANNRRDHITGCIMFHRGHILQVVEGGRSDLDRLLRRLRADPRHTGLRVIADGAVARRSLDEPMALCADPAALLQRVGLPCLSRVTAPTAETMLELRRAA